MSENEGVRKNKSAYLSDDPSRTGRESFNKARTKKSKAKTTVDQELIPDKSASESQNKKETPNNGRKGKTYEIVKEIYSKMNPSWMTKETVKVPCVKGQKFSLRTTTELLVTNCSPEWEELLDLGDVIEKFNGKTIKTRDELRQELKEIQNNSGFVEIVRSRLKRAHPTDSSELPQADEILTGVEYAKCNLILVPNGILGLNFISALGKVYVSQVDNGFRSISKRCFRVGDAILSVSNGKEGLVPVSLVDDAIAIIGDSLTNDNLCTVVYERAITKDRVKFVRRALTLAKKMPAKDTRVADDVIEICQQELKDMLNVEERPGIRCKSAAAPKTSIDFLQKSIEVFSQVEQNVCPAYLINVAPRQKAMDTIRQLKHKKPGDKKEDGNNKSKSKAKGRKARSRDREEKEETNDEDGDERRKNRNEDD